MSGSSSEDIVNFLQCWENIKVERCITHRILREYIRISDRFPALPLVERIEDSSDDDENSAKKGNTPNSSRRVQPVANQVNGSKSKECNIKDKNLFNPRHPTDYDLMYSDEQPTTKFTKQTPTRNNSNQHRILQLGKRKERTTEPKALRKNDENKSPNTKQLKLSFYPHTHSTNNYNNDSHPKRTKVNDYSSKYGSNDDEQYNIYSPRIYPYYSTINDDDDDFKDSIRSSFYTTRKDADNTGFENLGNTCYLNAILQAVTSIPCFMHDLYSDTIFELLLNDDRKNNYHYEKESLLFAFMKIVYLKYTTKKNINLQEFKDALTYCRVFLGTDQQDAHEFMYTFFQLLEKEIFYLANKQKNIEGLDEMINLKDVPTIRNFVSEVEHTITCNQCGHKSNLFELFYDFSLDVPEDDSVELEDLFLDYFKSEEVERKCEKCDNQKAIIDHKFNTIPRILILHLKRFKQTISSFEKISSAIKFKLEISLDKISNQDYKCTPSSSCDGKTFTKIDAQKFTKLTSSEGDSDDEYLKAIAESKKTFEMENYRFEEENAVDAFPYKEENGFVTQLAKLPPDWGMPTFGEKQVYQLCSIVNHRGISKEFGHYTSDVYNFCSNSWHCFDDSVVTKHKTSDLDERKSIGCEEPYMFFFVNKKIVQ